MDPLGLVVAIFAFLFVFFIFASFRKKAGEGTPMAARLEVFRSGGESQVIVKEESRSQLKEQRSYSGLPILSAFLSQFKGSEKMALHLERAGVPLRVGEFYLIRWAMAGLFFIMPLIFGLKPFNIAIGLLLSVVGYMLPAMFVNNKKKSRTAKINAQLVDLLGLIANSLKSGYGLMQSFEFAARQMLPPISLEIRRMLREANLGQSAEAALNGLGERIESNDLDMVLTAINIQRAVGGNLAEILDKVGATMRERERIRGEISTLTAQQKMTGVVIGGLPVFMFAIFMVMNPGYMGLLFAETAGQVILGVSVLLEVVGYLVMKRIMAIEI